MQIKTFIVIGENIHCTRVLKRDGNLVDAAAHVIRYDDAGKKKTLPIPEILLKSADWENGKIKHCVAAIWQGLYGQGPAQEAGRDYLRVMAAKQEKAGASFLDVNVDEFSMDLPERIKAMQWTAALVQGASRLPLSIDSSNSDIMRAGLKACEQARGRPMVNSISLERIGLLGAVAEYQPAVVASAAGENGLPANTEERLDNLGRLIPQLTAKGIQMDWIHVDPLVYTISTEANNGKMFLDAVQAIRAKYGPAVHIIGGLSNVSFGMPARKLINQVFAYLAVEAGGDGGIVDPLQINAKILQGLDTKAEPFQLAKALLLGTDDFGMNFIAAHRAGKLG
ncbi:MAG: dihydropteroate synthase [Verrucomicrobia bacterium]|nr:dihydropteroate synthase [Verrucomicrobiota bacterium]MBU1733799.1 dihydropteroate synthase [Verrucomicrobiota bacterium]